MTIRTIIIALSLICNFIKADAQSYELGKVTIEELEEKFCTKDTTAPATILFKKARTFFTYNITNGFTANHVYEFKIKIYKKEGLSWANQKVKFYVGYESMNKEHLEFSNAITYNLENGSVIKTKLDGQGSFKNNINKFWSEKTITLPNVKVGSIIEFKYVLKSENIVHFPDFKIQYEIPVQYFEYKTELPEFYIYKPILIGPQKINTDTKIVSGYQNFVDKHNQTNRLSFKQINAFYSGNDIPALLEEPYVDNPGNYIATIQHELERVRMPEMPVKDYAMTWEGVVNTIFKSEKFGKELDEKSFLIEDVKHLAGNLESKSERLDLIFKFVQNKMNWNEINDYYTDKGVAKAYKDQTGNAAEINFILINMLTLAGIEANPVLVSTIENGVPFYPTRTGFNYVIAAAEIDGKQILLDATHKFTTPKILPLNVLNWTGRLVRKDGTSEEINLVPKDLSRKNINLIAKIDASGKLNGKVRIQKTDYDAYRFRIDYANVNEENYLEKLEAKLGDLKISNYLVENKKSNYDKYLLETFDFASDNLSDVIGEKIYINPILFFTSTKNPFTQENRQMPIYFGYPTQERYNINLEIPEGYAVEVLPKSIHILAENKDITYKFNIVNQENKIQISCIKEINNSIFVAQQYNGLKELFQKIIALESEKIVLKKI
ncbi:DUF3857 domain-containing protein [Flavobacterium piscis]|uniref:DUF3857 domain-containing protein n=1 Tax=Flavobacterium piscis TaxID=1114874 RepID=A0ABU1Y6G1_9FLAO|nr:DUF3857 domain-containing protein [Flavobacterium piscis]MDR7209813.1 hypothetical protein [Flavobacterium piscis]